jgi:hypothetical protein
VEPPVIVGRRYGYRQLVGTQVWVKNQNCVGNFACVKDDVVTVSRREGFSIFLDHADGSKSMGDVTLFVMLFMLLEEDDVVIESVDQRQIGEVIDVS